MARLKERTKDATRHRPEGHWKKCRRPEERSSPDFEVQADRRTLSIKLPAGWFGLEADVVLNVSTLEVDALIAALAWDRATMLEQPAMEYQEGFRYGTPDPRWRLEKQASTGNLIFSLRHLGFGWVHFYLPKQEAVNLGKALLLQAADRAPLN